MLVPRAKGVGYKKPLHAPRHVWPASLAECALTKKGGGGWDLCEEMDSSREPAKRIGVVEREKAVPSAKRSFAGFQKRARRFSRIKKSAALDKARGPCQMGQRERSE